MALRKAKRSLKIKLTFSEFCLKIVGKIEKQKKGEERGKMLQTVIEAIVAYTATNIDDLLVSLLFFAQAKSRKEDWQIVFGKYLGIALLTAISILGAYGLSFLPAKALAWLGLLPAWLGIKELRDKAEDKEAAPLGQRNWTAAVALVTLANGGDNVGVYIPLFAGHSVQELLLVSLVFLLLTGLWAWLGQKIARWPRLQAMILGRQRLVTVWLYFALSAYIVLKAYC